MKGGLYRQFLLFSFVSFHQQRAKRYQLYLWIHLVAFWGFCFSVVKFSSWVQSLSPIEVSSRTPTAPVRTGIGGTLENTPLFWSFCFSFKKLWIDRFIPSYYSNNDLYTQKKKINNGHKGLQPGHFGTPGAGGRVPSQKNPPKITSLNIIGSSNKKRESRRKKGEVSRSDGEVAGVHI